MYTAEIKNLSHKFSGQLILDDVCLSVPQGSIYGFLGPNGAGKTTTLKVMLGLLKKQDGTITLFGERLETQRIAVLEKIGTLIETPSIYAHLSATENLLVWQKVFGCSKQRIPEVLQTVGLSGTGVKSAGSFSLGMKQRLGLAVALLNRPSLLVLDEPTNGLDPNGIIEMRELLIRLNRQGITILISSHLLAEIEKLATHVAIINRGRVLYEGTLDRLLQQETLLSVATVDTGDNLKALAVLTESFSAYAQHGKIKIAVSSKQEIASLVGMLAMNNISVYEVASDGNDLEAVYMNLLNQPDEINK